MPEFIDPVFAKTSPKRSFSVIENERFGLVFAKTGSMISVTALIITDPNPGGATTANTVRFLLFFEPEKRKKRRRNVAVLRIRIRIHWIHVFLGLQDPDPLVRAKDLDPSIIMQKL